MGRKRKHTTRIKPIFKLIHLDGLGIKFKRAYTLGEACKKARWDILDVDYEIILPKKKHKEAYPKQDTLPGIKKTGVYYE